MISSRLHKQNEEPGLHENCLSQEWLISFGSTGCAGLGTGQERKHCVQPGQMVLNREHYAMQHCGD